MREDLGKLDIATAPFYHKHVSFPRKGLLHNLQMENQHS